MQNKIISRQRPYQRGQTMVLVAISLVSLLAMAALAIDIVTLYAARSEIQRAADAAALAGAKALADSGITTLLLADANFNTIKTWADVAKNEQIDAVLSNNLVAGQIPSVVSKTVDWSRQGNPHLTVSLKRTSLPTFFSKIWTRGAATVTATATAEVYNPANLPTITPIAPISVKPWLVANADPNNGGAQFIDPTTGAVELNVGLNVIGKSLDLTADCKPGVGCTLTDNPPKIPVGSTHVEYVPALVADNSNDVCPACAGGSDFERSIACADVNTYAALSCGSGATPTTWDSSVNPAPPPTGTNDSALGAECLIHASTSGTLKGQDTLDPSLWPANPMRIKAQSGPQNGNFVTTSNSIVTIPIIDTSMGVGTFPLSGQPLKVVGYMQAFVNWVQDGSIPLTTAGDINVTVLNIAGCSSSNNGANPVVGDSGSSPVPVRLITPP
jgi:Flp pilus assembly protein TadG